MTYPKFFSREMIIDTAFKIVREKGWHEVSARTIAKELGSSTMPIYSYFESISDLERELREKTHLLLLDYQKKPYTEDPLLNIAVGYVAFARDEKQLFRFMFLDWPDESGGLELSKMRESFFADFGEDSSEGESLSRVPKSGQEGLIQNSWIFTHGLAVLVNSGVLQKCSDETIERFLTEAGGAFYIWETQKGDFK